ncbi:hypothetical protein BT67DRAFT_82577 [Trichocladium antarcticum]|uniref:BHLH domain-containing protein n=1 Tax=Trichocladium antarcticum TaxID=1450529 RepID=A0AAN6ZBX2_9PEZI|nr:hypothetical protein BT67DRAFT_82577 [Trichocladium antarcticum]
MPRNTSLPTPASSTDMAAQDDSKMASLQLSFELPPPAVPSSSSGSMHYPSQPSETVKFRRRSSVVQAPPKEHFALPPPPTRSRKIIQMKPREESTSVTPTSSSKNASKAGSTTQAGGAKRKQPSTTSAAGKKIARKTAHSLIERRRRSKMNDEFAVLKGLIPACTGEMHKLAILQASIEYVRYLEDCVTQLKAQCRSEGKPVPEPRTLHSGLPSPSLGDAYDPSRNYTTAADACMPDVDMTSSSSEPSPQSSTPVAGRAQQPSISPALLPGVPRDRHNSCSSVSTDYHRYGYTTPATTSPLFGPQTYTNLQYPHSAFGSALTSPAILPQKDSDQEATAALLMLNQMDRRTSSSAGRGMSVRDLLG